MNPAKCDELDYIHFLVAAQRVFSNTEAAKCHPSAGTDGPAHDAYTRLLHRCQADGEALWQEVRPCVSLTHGTLVVDDTTLDKPYARAMEMVTLHWSGKHRRVVQGINLISLLWTDGEAHLPCDFRVYDKPRDRLSKVQAAAACFRQLVRQFGESETGTLLELAVADAVEVQSVGRLRWFRQSSH